MKLNFKNWIKKIFQQKLSFINLTNKSINRNWISSSGIALWESIDPKLKTMSYNAFKKSYRSYIIDNYWLFMGPPLSYTLPADIVYYTWVNIHLSLCKMCNAVSYYNIIVILLYAFVCSFFITTTNTF